jgi:hypothetical protein
MKDVQPAFTARVTLYTTEQGGRKGPIIGEWFGCPLKFNQADMTAWDCRLLTKNEPLEPGETKDFGIVFLTPEIGPVFALAKKFYLWEGHIIGEAHCVD